MQEKRATTFRNKYGWALGKLAFSAFPFKRETLALLSLSRAGLIKIIV